MFRIVAISVGLLFLIFKIKLAFATSDIDNFEIHFKLTISIVSFFTCAYLPNSVVKLISLLKDLICPRLRCVLSGTTSSS